MNKLDSIRKNLKIQKPFDLRKPLSINPQKWSNTLKPFVGKLPTNCLSVFDHFKFCITTEQNKKKKRIILKLQRFF